MDAQTAAGSPSRFARSSADEDAGAPARALPHAPAVGSRIGSALVRAQIELPNEVAAELAGSQDAVLRALEDHLDCSVFLRGNLVTLDGEDREVAAGERVVHELSDLIGRGHQIGPGTIAAVTGALDAHESPAKVLEDVVWRHRALRVAPKTVNQKRYVDSIRNNTITFGVGPAGTGKTFLAVAMAAAALLAARGQPHHPHPARGGGGRAPGFPAGRPDGQGRPLPAAALRCPARHDRPGEGLPAPRTGRDRDRALGLHARAARSTTRS